MATYIHFKIITLLLNMLEIKRKYIWMRQGVFGNRVLRKIFGPKRDEVTGEWRKLHNEELRDL
jgi:hypothetical protein